MKVIGLASYKAIEIALNINHSVMVKNVLQEETADGMVPTWSCYLAMKKYTSDNNKYKQIVTATGDIHNKPCAHLTGLIAKAWLDAGATDIWVEKKHHSLKYSKHNNAPQLTFITDWAKYALKHKGYTCKCEEGGGQTIADKITVTVTPEFDANPAWDVVSTPTLKSPSPTWKQYLLPKETTHIPQGESTSIPNTTRRDIYTAICSFYMLQEIEAQLSIAPRKRQGAHGGIADLLLRASLPKYTEEFSHRLGQNLFDYMTVASIGEARHSQKELGILGNPHGRQAIYKAAHQHDPREITAMSKYIFKHKLTGSGYGGPKWMKIAETAEEYMQHEYYWKYPTVFVDHCVDLAHNGGLMFNKGYIFDMPGVGESVYMALLDHKRKGSILDFKHVLQLHPTVLAYLQEAEGLGVVRGCTVTVESKKDPTIPTIKWGMQPLFASVPFHNPTNLEDAPHAMPDVSPQHNIIVESYPEREEAHVLA